jgi:hypothetical protein
MDPVEPRTVSILMRGSLSGTNLPSYHAIPNTTRIVVRIGSGSAEPRGYAAGVLPSPDNPTGGKNRRRYLKWQAQWWKLHRFGFLFGRPLTLSGAGEDCFRGLYLEVSLALVGVASPAYFQ